MSFAKDALDSKVNAAYLGKTVRKDLVQRIKKGTNVPTFVLEFLLAKFCASDDEEEIDDGLEAVVETLQKHYVRADESNAAQSRVSTKGSFKFIDKASVQYVEKDKRHWAALENFGSKRIAVSDRFFRNNDRLLEGGVWAEVTVAYNDNEEDNYTFYIEDLRPIQLAHFDFDGYVAHRGEFTRDEWLNLILRSVGIEPERLTDRQKFHFIARMASLVEANYNYIELGPRGTGKSYFFSEFSPYATLISGGQSTKSTLFYNNARRRPGLVSFWDTVAFDEVAGIRIKDPDTIQIMKDYMANGRFSRGTEVIANAGLSFVGNLDLSIPQIVNSSQYDLFQPMPKEFDLAVMDRFAAYIPGWEMPKMDSSYLTSHFGFISDYLAEAFHYLFKNVNVYETVNHLFKGGPAIEGRDEKGIKKTLCAFLKILHPDGKVKPEEFEQYVRYAIECRRRVKEQMNKRKPDGEFAKINLSYIDAEGREQVVYCPESKDAPATQHPTGNVRGEEVKAAAANVLYGAPEISAGKVMLEPLQVPQPAVPQGAAKPLQPQELHIKSEDRGYSFESVMGPYLEGAKIVKVTEPDMQKPAQVLNFVRFCELAVSVQTVRRIRLVTVAGERVSAAQRHKAMADLKQSLLAFDIELEIDDSAADLKEHSIELDNGWKISLSRGLDWYQSVGYFEVGAYDQSLSPCREMEIRIKRKGEKAD
ncbi:MAG: BREX system Lon protease-like protein BrxL [Burkholderia sp.]|jgi:ATP-dependent Lon protease